MKPRNLTSANYNELQKNITEELNNVDISSNPNKIPRLAISVASSLNNEDKTDPNTLESRKEVREHTK